MKMEKIKYHIKNLESKIRTKIDETPILDKYVIKQLFEVFMLGVIVFTSIIFASETFTQLIKQIFNVWYNFQYRNYDGYFEFAQVFVMTIPISTLFATVMTINRLSLNSEITVLRACGIGISRISKPVFVFAIAMTCLSLFINEFIVPATSRQAQLLAIYSLQQKHVPEGKKNYTLQEMNSKRELKRLFYVQECKDKTLKNITVLDLSNKDLVQLVQAKAGRTSDLGWVFKDAVAYTISMTDKVFNTALSDEFILNFGLESIDSVIKESASQYNYFKLLKHIYKNRNKPDFAEKLETKYRVELHDKIALPLTTLALALVGIPLAITPPRVRYNRGFLFSIIVIFVFYLIRAFSINLGETRALPPFLAAWLPVIAIFIIGAILYYRKAYKI
jgi:lipopolysaccharide export system permease protein